MLGGEISPSKYQNPPPNRSTKMFCALTCASFPLPNPLQSHGVWIKHCPKVIVVYGKKSTTIAPLYDNCNQSTATLDQFVIYVNRNCVNCYWSIFLLSSSSLMLDLQSLGSLSKYLGYKMRGKAAKAFSIDRLKDKMSPLSKKAIRKRRQILRYITALLFALKKLR